MPNTHTGHFVQVWKPSGLKKWDRFYHAKSKSRRQYRQHPNYVTVEGYTTSRTESNPGWYQMSRELPRRRAVKYAKAYRNAGFISRVIFQGNGGEKIITDEFAPR